MGESEFDINQLYESIALMLMSLTIDLDEEKTFEAVMLGDDVHMKVRLDSGEVPLDVVGRDYNELGDQLVLACLHKVSIDRLGALHHRPMQVVSDLHPPK